MNRAHDFIFTFAHYEKSLECDVCCYPFLDCAAKNYIRYEVGTEEGVLALFLHEFCGEVGALKDFVGSLDFGYLSAETNISEEELSALNNALKNAKNPLLIIGEDAALHARSANLRAMINALKKHANFEVKCEFALDSQDSDSRDLDSHILQTPQKLPEHNGCVIYVDSRESRESSESSEDSQDLCESTLRISREFARAWHLSDGKSAEFELNGEKQVARIALDADFSGIIGIFTPKNPLPNLYYRFKNIAIKGH